MTGIKFAVVREDPKVEIRVLQEAAARTVLLVASGGCTALSVKAVLPDIEVVAYDFNPMQLAHVERKNRALAGADRRSFNVGDPDSSGLNQCGSFEGLFRIVRAVFLEWVATTSEVEAFFSSASQAERVVMFDGWRASPYWPAVFASVFHEPLLHAMFGPDATQHAAPGSYPGYFQDVVERGFQRADAHSNPFLQHIFLGYYHLQDAPAYLQAKRALDVELRLGGVPDMGDLSRFDVVHLSNIFDWCDASIVSLWATHLQRLAPGASLIVRQLNNQRDFSAYWGNHFELQDGFSTALTHEDRSLFYNRIQVWRRR